MIRGAVVLLLAGGCAADDGGPRLSAVTPASPVQGATVEIDGSRFCGASGDCTRVGAAVQLGTSSPFIDAVPMTWTATVVTAGIPLAVPAGKTALVMTVNGLASNELEVDVQPAAMGAR